MYHVYFADFADEFWREEVHMHRLLSQSNTQSFADW